MSFKIPYENRGAYDVEWCYDCERMKEDCACEELSDHFREVNSGADPVCVHAPAVPESHNNLTAKQRFDQSVNHEIRRMMKSQVPESFEDWLRSNNDSIEIGT